MFPFVGYGQVSNCQVCFLKVKESTSSISSEMRQKKGFGVTYLSKKFTHHSIPFSGFLVPFPILMVVYPLERIVEFYKKKKKKKKKNVKLVFSGIWSF